jgi:hypothetical protein
MNDRNAIINLYDWSAMLTYERPFTVIKLLF